MSHCLSLTDFLVSFGPGMMTDFLASFGPGMMSVVVVVCVLSTSNAIRPHTGDE